MAVNITYTNQSKNTIARFVSNFVEATRTNQNRDPIDCNAGIRHLEVVASLFDKTSFKKVS